MAKAHKNPIFVLRDGCRELSSAATSPAGCIWQQCARQQIAATYHATCRRACCRELPPCNLPPWRYRRHAYPSDILPAAHTTVHTAVALPPRRYRKKLPSCATAEELPPCNLPAGAYYRTMGPAPSGRVIRM